MVEPLSAHTSHSVARPSQVEFVKDYKLEYNNSSNYAQVPNSNGTYLPVEFQHRVPVGYMKVKGKDLWLHEDDHSNLFFDKIRNAKHMMYNYEKRQPVVLWFDYLVYGGFRVFKFTGSGPNWIEGVIDRQYRSTKNMAYLTYENNKISWTRNVSEAIIFIYDKVEWNEYVIKPYRFKPNSLFK
ncbi:MAG: hypothetical protein MUO21_10655 [Nitrososphaeraceae archaeon]|nr:hypothetical protein [Nitrososphaeraceae archaeon]